MSVNLAAVSLLAVIVAWLFCVFASASGWHRDFTGPVGLVLTVPLVACAIWLNRAAGKTDGEDPE